MQIKLPLLAAASVCGVFALTSLNAADAPTPAPAGGAPAPMAASASAAASAGSAAKPAASAPAASAPMARQAPKPDLTKLPAASDKKDLTFDKDIAPMLKASCSSCHGDTRPKAGLSILTKDSILKGGQQKDKDIVPGHGDQSNVLLYAADAVARAEMPPLRNRTAATNPIAALTKDQLAILRAWIDQGAK